MTDAFTVGLDAAAAKVAAGAPVAALQEIAALLEDRPGDPRPYRAAFEALSAAVADPAALGAWEGRGVLYRRLVLQEACPERPLIFHHGLASLLTSENTRTAGAIAAELAPVLADMLAAPGAAPSGLVLLLLVVRAVLPADSAAAGLSPCRISGLHLAHFRSFGEGDLALPYSVMFNPALFGANRADLLRAYGTPGAALAPDAGLGLRHLLLLEWLGGGPYFTDPDNADLLAALADRLGPGAPDAEYAAARSLVLRHWRPGSVLTASAVGGLGLSDAVVAAATALDRPRPAERLAARAGQGAVRRLESRPWQAVNAARGRAALSLPMLAGRQRRVRVAVCVSGQLRGWRAALESWRKVLLPHADCEIFVHSWAAVGRAGAQPFRAVLPFEGADFCAEWRRIGTLEGFEAMQARYPSLFAALEVGATIGAEDLKAAYGATEVVVEDDAAPRFAAFSNQDKMHYKIHAAQALAAGWEHDLVLRIRPDLSLRLAGFDWRDLAAACRAEPVIWCDRSFGVHYGKPMIGDQLAIGAPATMATYAATWDSYAELAGLGLAGAPPGLTGHVSLAQSCWLSGIRPAWAPLKLGPLLDPEPLSRADIRAALATDSAGRQDSIDRALIAAADRDAAALPAS